MKFTKDALIKKGFRKNAAGQWYKPSPLSRDTQPQQLPHAQPQHHPGSPLEGPRTNETQSPQRLVVRITGRRVALLDPDNFAGGCKFLIDQLRYAKIIPEDNPAAIELVTAQERVATKAQEGTEVDIRVLVPEELS